MRKFREKIKRKFREKMKIMRKKIQFFLQKYIAS